MNKTKTYLASGGLPEFILTRKSIKRIHLRIGDDGTVQISAPMRVPLADIRKMLSSNLEWINAAQKRREEKCAARPQARDGGSVVIGGRSYPLSVIEGRRNSCHFCDNGLAVRAAVTEPENEMLVAEVLERFLRKQAQPLFEQSLMRMYPLIEPLGAAYPVLKIRKMTSRWGTCNVKTKVITLNLCLARADEELIDSVVLHELIHLINFPHDERFHSISASLMPDYKQRRKKLNSLDIIY